MGGMGILSGDLHQMTKRNKWVVDKVLGGRGDWFMNMLMHPLLVLQIEDYDWGVLFLSHQ